jgi:uncharacterized protein (DUF697 family)
MTDRQNTKCHAIIHSAATLAAAAASPLAQLPGSDNAVIVPIQVGMVISLGAVFGIKLDKSAALSTITTASTTIIGRTVSQVLVGWIPVIGNAINAGTAFAVTEGAGWIIAEQFAAENSEKSVNY